MCKRISVYREVRWWPTTFEVGKKSSIYNSANNLWFSFGQEIFYNTKAKIYYAQTTGRITTQSVCMPLSYVAMSRQTKRFPEANTI